MVSTRGQRRLAGDAASPMQVLQASKVNGNVSADTKDKGPLNGSPPNTRKTRVPKTRKNEKDSQSEKQPLSLSAIAPSSFHNFTFPVSLPTTAHGKASVTVSFAPANDSVDQDCIAQSVDSATVSETCKMGQKIRSSEGTSKLVSRVSSSPLTEKNYAVLHCWSPLDASDDSAKVASQRLPNTAIRVPLFAFEDFLDSLNTEHKKLITLPVSQVSSKRKRSDDVLATERVSKRSKDAKPRQSAPEDTQSTSCTLIQPPKYRIATTGGYTKDGSLIIPGQRVEIWGSDDEESERAAASRRKAESKIRAASVLKSYRARQAANAENAKSAKGPHAPSQEATAHSRSLDSEHSAFNPTQDTDREAPQPQTIPGVPATPELSRRAWGLSSFVPQSVSRLVPSLSLFSRSQTHLDSSNEAQQNTRTSNPPTVTISRDNTEIALEAQHIPSPNHGTSNTKAIIMADHSQNLDAVDHKETGTGSAKSIARMSELPPDSRNQSVTNTQIHSIENMPLMRRARQAKAAEEKRLFASREHLIKLEVDRRVREALEQQKLVAKWQTEKVQKAANAAKAVPESNPKFPIDKKRKRRPSSPLEIPNPEGCSYGMDINYFCSSSEDEDSSEEDETSEVSLAERGSPSNRPAKRSRLSHGLVTPSKETIGDPRRATPYTGKVFADPQTNVFMGDTTPSSSLVGASQNGPQASGRFQVPSSSESDGEGQQKTSDVRKAQVPTLPATIVHKDQPSKKDTIEPRSSDSQLKPNMPASKIHNAKPQGPPPAPTPAHAALPSTNTLSQVDALAQARAQATRYAPKQPSGLRAASRLSTSTTVSNDDVAEAAELANHVSMDTAAVQIPNVLSDTTGSETHEGADVDAKVKGIIDSAQNYDYDEPVFDSVVVQALAALKDDDLVPIVFTKDPPTSYGFNIDPEVAAALEASWGPEDDANAVANFEAGLTHFKAAQYGTLLM